MPDYTVIGIYTDPAYQRFCEFYEATDADMAEAMAGHEHPGLVVAGVIAGHHRAVDAFAGVGPTGSDELRHPTGARPGGVDDEEARARREEVVRALGETVLGEIDKNIPPGDQQDLERYCAQLGAAVEAFPHTSLPELVELMMSEAEVT